MFFDGTEVNDRDSLKGGAYDVVITDGQFEENSKGTGAFAKLHFDVIGESIGFIERFNIKHENVTAENIGKKQFKRLVVAATGSDILPRLEDLFGKKLNCDLGEREHDGNHYNFIEKVRPFTGSAPAVDDMPF